MSVAGFEGRDMQRLRSLKEIQKSKSYTQSNVEFFGKFFDEYLKEMASVMKLLSGSESKFRELMVDVRIMEMNKGDSLYVAGRTSILNLFGVFRGREG